MPIASYKLIREQLNITGALSQSTSNTYAINALIDWKNLGSQRDYKIQKDDEDALWVLLSWEESNISAGLSLEHTCNKWGVGRIYQYMLTDSVEE